jgi:hypothetical protein
VDQIPEGAQRSDDGNYWWDGTTWQLVHGGASGGADVQAGQAHAGGGAQPFDLSGFDLANYPALSALMNYADNGEQFLADRGIDVQATDEAQARVARKGDAVACVSEGFGLTMAVATLGVSMAGFAAALAAAGEIEVDTAAIGTPAAIIALRVAVAGALVSAAGVGGSAALLEDCLRHHGQNEAADSIQRERQQWEQERQQLQHHMDELDRRVGAGH